MRPIALASLLALSACAPSTFYYREGAPVAAVDRALARCTEAARRAVPEQIETRYTPLEVRRLRVCDAAGNCELEIETEGGDPYDVDVNAERRAAQITHCMAAARYRPVTLPACPPDVARAAPAGPSTTLPRLTENACAVARADGLRIVTRAPAGR